jgi:isopenicillin-N epimerase
MTAIDAAAGYGFPDAGVAAAAGLWGLDPAVAMLNHGGFGACPIAVLRRQAELRRQMEAEPVRFFLKELPPLRDAARQELASWLGAGPEDLVFLPNATAGVNSVLRSLRFRPGDELLVTDHGYNACTNVARYVARRDAARLVVVAVPLPVESPRQVIDSVLAGVSGRTRLAILDHVTSPSGVVFPIEELVRRLGAVGVDTLVDGAHAPGMISLDLGRIGAAYYTGNLHKWACTPKGAGFLHVRPDRQEGLQPPIISHGYNQARPGYSRFQDAFDWMGTDDPTAWLCVGEALDLLGRLLPGGREALADRNRRCVLAARRMLCGLLRISAQAYNHPGQYRRLADALEVLLAAKIR